MQVESSWLAASKKDLKIKKPSLLFGPLFTLFNHSSEIICSRSQGAFLCHELFFDDFNFMIMMPE